MDRSDNPSAVICGSCGEAYILPEDEAEGNLPRVLVCGHIYCTSCLLSIECDGTIVCPECEVESILPEGGVHALQEDSRIIGLIYTAQVNKQKNLRTEKSMKHRKNKFASLDINDNTVDEEQQPTDKKSGKVVDEALAQAAENLALLKQIQETLKTGLAEQVKVERVRLEVEIKQSAEEALYFVQTWKQIQLSKLSELEGKFSTSQVELGRVQEQIKSLGIAMQMAREVLRVPFLEQYCTLDKVVETLKAPVDKQSFDMECITLGSGLSCVVQSEESDQSLTLFLKMEASDPEPLSKFPPVSHQQDNSYRKSPGNRAEIRQINCVSPSHNKSPSSQKQDQGSPRASSPLTQSSHSNLSPHPRASPPQHYVISDIRIPDVIIEEIIDEEKGQGSPPTGPELANDKWRIQRRRKHQMFGNKRPVSKWVVVTHIVNPSHFYVCSMLERTENEILSRKINDYCCSESSHFTDGDTVGTGLVIFVRQEEGLWCRGRVVEISQIGRVETVRACLASQLAGLRVFLIDCGKSKGLTIQSREDPSELPLEAVNTHLRKMCESLNTLRYAPQAIRCSLMDLVPYDLSKGWCEKSRVEFRRIIGSAAVEMRRFGRDRDSLLVDLRKVSVDHPNNVPISVREYLVFIEVARFFNPVLQDRKPLSYYPPVYPKVNTEVNAVVCHINSPADFYIQLVDSMEFSLLSAKLQECYNATTVAKGEDLRVYCPVIEQAYVARCQNNLWHRAQVIGHQGEGKVEVRYVDLGCKKTLTVRDLRKIKDEFFALPSMAIHCCLSEVNPVDGETWDEACVNRFISLADQKLVTIVATASVPRSKPLPVKLFESGLNGPEENIAELLVKEELACFKEELKSKDARRPGDESDIWDPPLNPESPTQGADASDKNLNGDQEPLQVQLEIQAQLKDLKVRVSHVNSPSSFYVQLTQFNSHLKRICELVKQECASVQPDEDAVWKADMYCAAHVNGVWERGQLCADVTSSKIAEVKRCDHGNIVKVHVSNLRPLPQNLIGSLALECTLTNIRPAGGLSTWSATACDLISSYLTGASALMTIKELTDKPPQPITLFCSTKKDQLVSIADFLTSEGLALRERKPRQIDAGDQKPKDAEAQSPVMVTQTESLNGDKTNPPPASPLLSDLSKAPVFPSHSHPKPAPRTIITAEKVQTQLYQPPELPCLGHIQMNVSAIGEDGVIYVRTQNAESQLEQLRKRIQQSMKTLPRQKPYTWKSVLGCAVIGSDMLWYRGQLLEVLGGHVKVQYVDYGLVENIPVVHVYPKLLCDDVPQLCIPCMLHNISPVGGRWQVDAVALLRELLLNRSVDMQVMELPSDPRAPLSVALFLEGMSLSKIMCHHEHASIERTLSEQKGSYEVTPPSFLDDWDINTEGLRDPEEQALGPFIYPNLPQKGEHFKARVKHLWTPNELFLWPLEGTDSVEVDGETLDEALERINEDIDRVPQLSSFPQGGPCLAEYSDGQYYRAKLTKVISVEPVMLLVQHVDFGSDDTLPVSKLRQMPAGLLGFPSRALKVKVAGFKAPRLKTEGGVLPYSPEWSMKATMAMLDLLNGNTTAYVVAQEPELTVLLYKESGELVHLSLVKEGLAELDK
ncbi:RING finger protein 17 [Halichoeres trimaculatus]|uniref:RING finger protein 17 n=1 Tax=Halichoeres trimaculatus TaxID=147232 RepID=UPI003D9F5ECC